MSSRAEFIAAVQAAAQNTPYVVRETPEGFDLTIDVADARWATLVSVQKLKKVFTYEVKLDEPQQKMVITDVSNEVTGGAGGTVPQLRMEKKVTRGRIYEKSFHKEFGVDLDSGKVGEVVGYSFDSSTGRAIIRDVAKAQGWSEKMPAEQKGALIVAIVTAVLLVIVFGGLGIWALLH
ncbi:hypothetical protein G9U51_02980 [Calidifontibacter sp. DB0510]|uniref:Uncharacterized protein n=1 Tax=Metallococcus carri TaxID=1656884 RepID=A0A967B504_9MICO|nr:hypothetical protein [Metallococcus carri]NHN54746.1 hypothetical protein [Metallococcus carri]NOP37091.1 hypothetical protein [Calidifontibacter sp. DB2511S]